MAQKTYTVFNGPMVTAAAPAAVATGTAIKTLLQLKPAAAIQVVAWGISLDGVAAATPGKVELVETDVAATVTAFVAADVQPHSDPNAAANSAGAGGIPLNLGTTASGYTATAEGTILAARMGDVQLVAPTGGYSREFSLGREFEVAAGKFLRVRATFAATVNALCWVTFAV